jgi:hypothetical protein
MAGRCVDLTPQVGIAAVGNRCGKGASLYLAGTYGETLEHYALPEHRDNLTNAVLAMAPQRFVLKGRRGNASPANVELVVRRQPGRYILHLVNYGGIVPRPFETVAVQQGLELEVRRAPRMSSARALVAGRRCEIGKSGGAQRIRLPALQEYEVLVLEIARGGR